MFYAAKSCTYSPIPLATAPDEGTRLAHDTLAPLVRRDFDHSALPGQQARRLLESRSIDWKDGAIGPLLDDAALTLIDKGLAGMRNLPTDELRLLEASRQAQAQRKRRRRLTQFAGAAAGVLLLALLGFAAYSNYGQVVAETKSQLSESQRIAQLAQQQLAVDPVVSLNLALAAFPADSSQTVAPEAEYALRQAVLASRERKYVTTTIGAPDQVAIRGNRVALGGEALQFTISSLTTRSSPFLQVSPTSKAFAGAAMAASSVGTMARLGWPAAASHSSLYWTQMATNRSFVPNGSLLSAGWPSVPGIRSTPGSRRPDV